MFPHEYKRALLESQAVSSALEQERRDLAAMKGVDAYEAIKSLAATSGGFSKDNPPPRLSTPAESISPKASAVNGSC